MISQADKLAGGPLAALEWRGRGDLELGAWAAALPALERAVVAAEEGRAALRAPLAGATSLRYLRVSGSRGVEMDADCLPPALEEADIQQPPTTALRPLAAGCAGTLRRLSLARCRAALDCAHLARLTSLTSLALSGCHLSFVPAQLAALTQLEELSLATNRLEGEGWAHLLPLRRLSRLDLRHQLGNRRLQLHPGLLALPSLQVRRGVDRVLVWGRARLAAWRCGWVCVGGGKSCSVEVGDLVRCLARRVEGGVHPRCMMQHSWQHTPPISMKRCALEHSSSIRHAGAAAGRQPLHPLAAGARDGAHAAHAVLGL